MCPSILLMEQKERNRILENSKDKTNFKVQNVKIKKKKHNKKLSVLSVLPTILETNYQNLSTIKNGIAYQNVRKKIIHIKMSRALKLLS